MSTLAKIVREAKRLRKAHPNKYKSLSNPWSAGYIKEAARRVEKGLSTKPAKKKAKPKPKPKSRKAAKPKATKRRRKQSVKGKKPRKVGSIQQAIGAKHRRKRSARKVSGKSGRRRVGNGGGGGISTGTLLGIGALGLVGYLLLKDNDNQQTNYPTQLPPLQQTGNVTRDQQSASLVNWALAAGVAITAITSLIDRLNNSSDNEVTGIYTDVSTTGDLGSWV